MQPALNIKRYLQTRRELLPCGSSFAASGFVHGGFMLGDLLLFVGPAAGRCGVSGGDLVLDGTVGACAGDQLA